MLLTAGLQVGGSHYPLVGFDNLLEWLTELRNILFTRLLVCCKRLRNSQVEEMPRAGQGSGRGHGASVGFTGSLIA